MRWIGRLVALVLLLALATSVVLGGSVASGSETSPSAPIVLHLRFRPVVRFGDGQCGPIVSTSGRYALVSISSPSPYGCVSGFVLIDDLTGKRTVIREPGSTGLQAFGAPWIFLEHNGHDELYN